MSGPEPRPIIIGHRGAAGYRPEHTAAAFRLAFALGADAVEPDVVVSQDGVLVVRHENEISATTDVAQRAEFASRRCTKLIDGVALTGWFTEDFSWAELATLRARERLGSLRPSSASFDDRYPLLRLVDVLTLVDQTAEQYGRPLGVVAELKHPTYFESIGLPVAELYAAQLDAAGWDGRDGRLITESFELPVLERVRTRGIGGRSVFLVEADGAPFDEVAAHGGAARTYAQFMDPAGLYALAKQVDGISVDKQLMIVRSETPGEEDGDGRVGRARVSALVDDAHAAGLRLYCWTLRPENCFLDSAFRVGTDLTGYGNWHREFALLMSAGVDGVFVDHPDLAIAVRDPE